MNAKPILQQLDSGRKNILSGGQQTAGGGPRC